MQKLRQRVFRFRRPMTLGVRAVVERSDGNILLVRHTYTKGLFFPGGGIEKGERAETSLLRELKEEGGVELTGAAPSALATVVLGVSELSVPVKGGVLVPSPDVLLPLATDGNGELAFVLSWPAGLTGVPLHWQAWVSDATGPAGFSASNGLRSVGL